MPFPLTPEFWASERKRLLATLSPHIGTAVQAGVTLGASRLSQAGIAFDETGAHAEATAWAIRHTDEVLGVVGSKVEQGVGDVIGQWLMTPGADIGDLEQVLMGALDGNRSRSNLIGVTEVTRAIAQGNILSFTAAGVTSPPMFTDATGTQAYAPPAPHPGCRCDVGVVHHQGQLLVVWFTNKDDLVCVNPIETPWGTVGGCRALQGVCISEGEYLGRKIK